jgi:hypothetical protein
VEVDGVQVPVLPPRCWSQGFHFRKLKFIGVIDKTDKQDISEISDQI